MTTTVDPYRQMFLTTVKDTHAKTIHKAREYIGFTKFADVAAILAGFDLGLNLSPVEVEAIADILLTKEAPHAN